MFCDACNTDEDYFWFERICMGRFILMLPHPAHAVFLLQAPDPLVLWSENAWAAAKHCGLLPDRAIAHYCDEKGAAHGLFNFADIFQAFVALRHIANPQWQTESFMRLLERKASKHK